jgi:hypothetical protein
MIRAVGIRPHPGSISSDPRCAEHNINMKIDFGMAFQKASMPGIYGDDVSKCSLAIVGIAIHLLPSTY